MSEAPSGCCHLSVMSWPSLRLRPVTLAGSSSRRRAAAYRCDAGWFEGARLQCRAPLVDGVIEQFEHQAKGGQFLFLDRAVVVAFEGFADDGVDLALHRQQVLAGFR